MECFVYPKSVLLWYGAIAQIPSGYRLCDGHQGTPDLRDKFILGAGGTFTPGATGGVSSHTHSLTTAGHTHSAWPDSPFNFSLGLRDVNATTDQMTATTDPAANLPPYKSLCWIMKL